MPNRHNISGLSLIELIFVLAIIGIIISIAIPTYDNLLLAKRRQDAIVSLLNMQQEVDIIRLEFGKLKPSELAKLKEKSELGYYKLEFVGDDDSYTLSASPIAEQFVDDECNTFMLDNLGKKTVSGAGVDCWN